MVKKIRVTREGQPCRKCDTPVCKKIRGNTDIYPGQKYYFKSHLFCPKCKAMYMIESEKVIVNGSERVVEKKKGKRSTSKKERKLRHKKLKKEHKLLRKSKKRQSVKLKRKQNYIDYINSSEWRDFRKMIINERGSFCERCDNEFESVHIHHIHYKNFKKELRGDVLVLCESCHNLMHKHLQSPPYTIEKLNKLL